MSFPRGWWDHGWIIKRGQKYITSHYEKSSRDKNFEAEKRETFSQVGEFTRSESERAVGKIHKPPTAQTARKKSTNLPENLAAWLGQTSVEVGLSGPTSEGEVPERIP